MSEFQNIFVVLTPDSRAPLKEKRKQKRETTRKNREKRKLSRVSIEVSVQARVNLHFPSRKVLKCKQQKYFIFLIVKYTQTRTLIIKILNYNRLDNKSNNLSCI